MSDSYIYNLNESSKIKSGDYTVFDVVDPNTGQVHTKKVDYKNLVQTISASVINNVTSHIDVIQNNINGSVTDVTSKFDKRGTNFNAENIITGPLVITAPMTAVESSFFGNMDLNSFSIKNVATPSLTGDASNKLYVDTSCEAVRNASILKSGGVMTSGNITLAAEPTEDKHATTKGYVDTKFIAKPSEPTDGQVLTYVTNTWSAVTQNYIPKPSQNLTQNYVLTWNGTDWVANSLANINNGTFMFNGSYIPKPAGASNGKYLTYNNGTWNATDLPAYPSNYITKPTASTGQYLTFNGSNWVATSLPRYPDSREYIPQTGGTNGQVLTYSNGSWIAGNKDSIPVGMIAPFPTGNIPNGWFICDGSHKDINQYNDLFKLIGYSFGGGGMNFALPDYREMFLRGHGGGRGIDSDGNRSPGSFQGSNMGAHWHGVGSGTSNDDGYFIVRNWSGVNDSNVSPKSHSMCGECNGNNPNSSGYLAAGTLGTTNNINVGTSDNRPTNIAVVYCIKAFSASTGRVTVNYTGLQVSDFTGTNIQVGESGYQRLPSGLWMQWGNIQNPDEDLSYNFPISFPNQAFQVFATNRDRQGSAVDNSWGHPIDRTQFRLATKRSTSNSQSLFATAWFAIGT